MMRDVRLEWMPEFVGIAESGDLRYSYGTFTFMVFLQRTILYNHPGPFTPSGKTRTTEIGIMCMIDHL